MSQATDADDPDAIRLLHAELHHRIEHGDAGAKRRSGRFETERLRQRQGKGPIATDPIGETAVSMRDGAFLLPAKIVVAGLALMTERAARRPAGPLVGVSPAAQPRRRCLRPCCPAPMERR